MRLLSQELREVLPPLGSQRGMPDPWVYAKFWIPYAGWTWYVTEGERRGDNFLFFGYVVGEGEGWEEFSLRDLEGVRSPQGGKVVRDLDFRPKSLGQIVYMKKAKSSWLLFF